MLEGLLQKGHEPRKIWVKFERSVCGCRPEHGQYLLGGWAEAYRSCSVVFRPSIEQTVSISIRVVSIPSTGI